MSFIIENKDLINALTVAGANHINKYGQQQTLDPNSVSIYILAKKLLIDLQRQVDPANAPPKPPPIGTPDDVDVNLDDKKMRNLGDFITWIAQNRLTWNGNRFAWSKDDYEKKLVPPEAGEFTGYSIDREREDGTRQPKEETAWALKDELIAFITYLRDSEENRKNDVMRVMLGKLINKVNEQLPEGDAKIETKPKPKAALPAIDPNIVIDGLPSVLDPKDPYNGITAWNNNFANAQVKLTAGILSNGGAFRNWLLNLNVKVQEGVHVGPASVNTPESDNACLAMHILYKRAVYLAQNVGTAHDEEVPNYSKMTALYLKQIQEVGKTFTGKDGKPCAVTAPGTATDTTGTEGKTPGDKKTGPASPQDVVNIIAALMQPGAMPFDTRDINFDRIQRFFSHMENLFAADPTNMAAVNNQAIVQSSIAEARKYMAESQRLLKSPMTEFSLAGGIDQLHAIIREPIKAGDKPLNTFISYLMGIVKFTQHVVIKFAYAYGDTQLISMYPAFKNTLYQQTDSTFNYNWQVLQQWRGAATQNVPRRT